MKKLLIPLTLLQLTIFSPGSPTNPYVMEDRYDGSKEIHSELPDLQNQNMFTPGSPTNPYIIEQDPVTGKTKMHTQFPHSPFGPQGGER